MGSSVIVKNSASAAHNLPSLHLMRQLTPTLEAFHIFLLANYLYSREPRDTLGEILVGFEQW